MVYAVKKLWHYLLANKFIFFIDHQDLLYLVTKPCLVRCNTHLMLILMEFDFTIVVREGITHVLIDHMSRIPNGQAHVGV